MESSNTVLSRQTNQTNGTIDGNTDAEPEPPLSPELSRQCLLLSNGNAALADKIIVRQIVTTRVTESSSVALRTSPGETKQNTESAQTVKTGPFPIRPYMPSDAPELARMLTEFQNFLKKNDSEGRMKMERFFGIRYLNVLIEEIAQHDGAILICTSGECIVGFSACLLLNRSMYDELEYQDECVGRITELYVIPDFRRRGIGTQLLGRMEKILHSRGCTRVELGVMSWNVKARALYERVGYKDQHVRMAKTL